MLSIAPKATEPIRIAQAVDKYVNRIYDANTARSLQPFLERYEFARGRIIGAEQNEATLQSLAEYYCYLEALSARLPANTIGLRVVWQDSVSRKNDSDENFNAEKFGVLFNIASTYSYLGVNSDIKTAEGAKAALNNFMCAAGIFDNLQGLSRELGSRNCSDASQEFLQMASSTMLAQCYLSMYEKMDKASSSKANLAKLAKAISRHYGAAYQLSNRPPLSKVVSAEWIEGLHFLELAYKGFSQLWQGLADREVSERTAENFGRCIARFRVAKEIAEQAMCVRGIRGASLELGRELLAIIVRSLQDAERLNSSVYIQAVPKATDLADVDDINMINPKFPPPLRLNELPEGSQLLDALVSPMLLHKLQEFKEQFGGFLTEEGGRYNALVRKVQESISSWNLPHKLASGTGEDPSAKLWTDLVEVQQLGGYAHLELLVQSLQDIYNNCSQVLADCDAKLKAEEEQDNKFRRAGMTQRPPSSSANITMKQELQKFSDKIGAARKVDQNTLALYGAHRSSIHMLSMSKAELLGMLPAPSPKNDSPEAVALRKALAELETSHKAAEGTLGKFASAEYIQELSSTFLKKADPNRIQHPIEEFVDLNAIAQELYASRETVQQALDKVRDANRVFDGSSGSNSSGGDLTLLKALEDGIRVYKEVAGNVGQGMNFYKLLYQHLALLQKRVVDYTQARTSELNQTPTYSYAPPPSSGPGWPASSYPAPQFQPPPQYQAPPQYQQPSFPPYYQPPPGYYRPPQ
mmetsp:Transcript_32055/g.55294  ORF Transcript_32055/g.55294 Transcript_32055/m.55294 type:complete len:752 (-) Transcript_32055:1742-3997(-)|eukprot:CAMPEP_0204918362 /NCGR_PEP_ID=MMETSP1397-20131031/16106_1 /ASSEMBLY_ACC=CAM_ASM_000891 /TAXON_ID=49980 /ORGANISM="Climacostomum Climacostomum virens, Strain Stock W-24" /LENGTH=751 /DNA_ID=CAMNT_0052091633 /DNA_START=9 /DNA_END=2261 /DNA_ORIENTATION=+